MGSIERNSCLLFAYIFLGCPFASSSSLTFPAIESAFRRIRDEQKINFILSICQRTKNAHTKNAENNSANENKENPKKNA